jgi:hypothetical protein
MITDLSAMMIERLKRYQEVSKSLPERVFVFRDGVSEVRYSILTLVCFIEVRRRDNSTPSSKKSFPR